MAEALEYGIVGINTGIISKKIHPFGGMKESAMGLEDSRYGIEKFIKAKYVCMGLTDHQNKENKMQSEKKVEKFTEEIFFVTFLFAIILMTSVFFSCGNGNDGKTDKVEPVRPVKLMTVFSGETKITRNMPGRVRAVRRVDLSFQVPGRLIELPIQEGQKVTEGQLLARLDPEDYESNLKTAQAKLAKAEASFSYAETEYDRYVRIRKRDAGAVSDAMISQRKAAVKVSRADIASAAAAVLLARDQLSNTRLTAPFSGVVAIRYVDNFRDLQAKESVLSLQDISEVEIIIDVPEQDMAVIREETVFSFAEFAAAPQKRFEIRLKEFSGQADPLTQTYRVVFVMPDPKAFRVLPGMTANVILEVTAAEQDSKIVIPAVSVFSDDQGNPNIWVVDREKMTVHQRKVTIGDLSGTEHIEIIDGLEHGEMIALSGVTRLREGLRVRVFNGSF